MKKCVDRQKEEQYIKPIGKIGKQNREKTIKEEESCLQRMQNREMSCV